MNSELYYYVLVTLLLVAYLIIQFTVKAKTRYFIYFISGSVLGFYFDIVSFSQGYYGYPGFYHLKFFGLPLSMTFAEGFSVVITIYVTEFLRGRNTVSSLS